MDVENDNDMFTFTWSIHNFSHCALKNGDFLESPKFEVEFLYDKCYLRLYPRGPYLYNRFIGCFLHREIKSQAFVFRLSILKSNGLFEEKNAIAFLNGRSYFELANFLTIQELKKNYSSYIDNDTLTIRCQLWKKNTYLPKSIMCHAYTKIKVLKLRYTWALNEVLDSKHQFQYNKIYQSTKIPSFSSEIIPSLEIQLLNRESEEISLKEFDEDTIYVAINIPSSNNYILLVYGIHLLHSDGSVAHSITGQRFFEKSTTIQSAEFSFLSKRKLLSNEEQYLPKGTLTLQCEFYISSDETESAVETFEYRKKDDLKLRPNPTDQALEEKELLKKNMQKLFTDGEFSDFVVSTSSQQFPVHRAILCTQSEVFSAMLKNNMKEQNSNVVEIKDLEDDTVSKLLTYLYTNTLDDIDIPTAQKLYYAADKYRIVALQKSCSNYLKRKVDASNVDEILVLADTHQDHDLKSRTIAFILEHVFEVINSDNWKNLMATHSHITSEVMQEIICKNMFQYKKAL